MSTIQHRFCNFCGGQVTPQAIVCVGCGGQIGDIVSVNQPASAGAMVVMALLTLVFPIVGIIFGLMGLCRKGKEGQGVALLIEGLLVSTLFYFALIAHHS